MYAHLLQWMQLWANLKDHSFTYMCWIDVKRLKHFPTHKENGERRQVQHYPIQKMWEFLFFGISMAMHIAQCMGWATASSWNFIWWNKCTSTYLWMSLSTFQTGSSTRTRHTSHFILKCQLAFDSYTYKIWKWNNACSMVKMHPSEFVGAEAVDENEDTLYNMYTYHCQFPGELIFLRLFYTYCGLLYDCVTHLVILLLQMIFNFPKLHSFNFQLRFSKTQCLNWVLLMSLIYPQILHKTVSWMILFQHFKTELCEHFNILAFMHPSNGKFLLYFINVLFALFFTI